MSQHIQDQLKNKNTLVFPLSDQSKLRRKDIVYFRKDTGKPVVAFVRSDTNQVNLSDIGKHLGRNYEFRKNGAFGNGFYNKTVFRNQNNIQLNSFMKEPDEDTLNNNNGPKNNALAIVEDTPNNNKGPKNNALAIVEDTPINNNTKGPKNTKNMNTQTNNTMVQNNKKNMNTQSNNNSRKNKKNMNMQTNNNSKKNKKNMNTQTNIPKPSIMDRFSRMFGVSQSPVQPNPVPLPSVQPNPVPPPSVPPNPVPPPSVPPNPVPLPSVPPKPVPPPIVPPNPVPLIPVPLPSKNNDRPKPVPSKNNDRPKPVPSKNNDRPKPVPSKHNDKPRPVSSKNNDKPKPVPSKNNDRPKPVPSKHNDKASESLKKKEKRTLRRPKAFNFNKTVKFVSPSRHTVVTKTKTDLEKATTWMHVRAMNIKLIKKE